VSRTRASMSKGGLVLACSHWARADVPWSDDETGEAAAVGNALHALCDAWIKVHTGTHAAMLRLEDAAARCDVSADSLPRLRLLWASALEWLTLHTRIGWQPERAYAWDFVDDAGRELPTSGHRDYSQARPSEWCGTADCVTWDDATLVVYDWKSGRADLATYDGQMAALAVAAARAHGAASVRVVLVRFRDDGEPPEVRERAFDSLDLESYADRFAEALDGAAYLTAEPKPGPHCDEMYCPARRACPASKALLASHPETAPLAEVLSTAIVTPEDAGRAYMLAARAEKLIKAMKERVKEVVQECGEAPTAPGKRLVLLSQSREYFSAERIDPLRREAIVGELRELGALRRSEWTEIREVKR